MRRAPIALLFALLAALLIICLPASAAPQIGAKQNGLSLQDERALHVYVDCWDAFKSRCGRNIVDDGLASGNPPSEAKVKEWTATMDRWLNPPEPVAMSSPATTSQVAPTPATASVAPAPASTGSYSIPSYIVECESGGDYGASNASGAYGAYQIMPGTASAYSCNLSTPEGQDECAARIYAAEGASPWACG